MMAEKKIKQLVVRCDEGLQSDLERFADDRGLKPAEVVRRAVRALITAAPEDGKPGVVAKPRAVEVSNTEELGPDSLAAPNRSLSR